MGAIPIFASRSEIRLDAHNVSVISAGGVDAVHHLALALKKFAVQTVSVVDKDDSRTPADLPGIGPVYVTAKRDFDAEIASIVHDSAGKASLHSILCEYDSAGLNRSIPKDMLNKFRVKYGFTLSAFAADVKFNQAPDDTTLELMYICWLSNNKGTKLGRFVAERIPVALIPRCFIDAAQKSAELGGA